MIKNDFDFGVTGLSVMARNDGTLVTIVGEIAAHGAGGPHPSGKGIYLTLTPPEAMSLVAMLQAIQAKFGYPAASTPTMTQVPPKKDRV